MEKMNFIWNLFLLVSFYMETNNIYGIIMGN